MSEFKAIGLSYKSTPIELRELISFEASEEAGDLLIKLKEMFNIEEALVVSTCNRTELYYSSNRELSGEIISLMSSLKGLDRRSVDEHFVRFDTHAAVNQLFRVSLGLESKVLGDIQIANQVKKAYQLSTDLDLAGPFLHRLMHTIFYANKRVVQETRLQDGTASVASVAVDVIESFIPRIDDPKVALIGLGEIGQYVLENLNAEGINLTLVNRTQSKAESFAHKIGANVAGFDSLETVIDENDVIVSAVATNSPTDSPEAAILFFTAATS